MEKKELSKRLIIFLIMLVFAFVWWGLLVFFAYGGGGVNLLRRMTGLKIHYYHWGLMVLLIASFLLVFEKRNDVVFGLLGFGLGSALNGSLSFLLRESVRENELFVYNLRFLPSAFFFLSMILIGMICYLFISKN